MDVNPDLSEWQMFSPIFVLTSSMDRLLCYGETFAVWSYHVVYFLLCEIIAMHALHGFLFCSVFRKFVHLWSCLVKVLSVTVFSQPVYSPSILFSKPVCWRDCSYPYVFLFIPLFVFWDRIPLCSPPCPCRPGWPWIPRSPLASASQVLELQAWDIRPGLVSLFFNTHVIFITVLQTQRKDYFVRQRI